MRRRSLLLVLVCSALLVSGAASAQGRKLNGPLAYSYTSSVNDFALVGERIVYEATGIDGFAYSLLSTPRAGGGPVLRLASRGGGYDLLAATPDGTRVVYRSGSVIYGIAELFSAHADGNQPPVKLHPDLRASEDVYGHRIAPDGGHVVYDQVVESVNGLGGTTLRHRLFSAPVDGSGTRVLLNPEVQNDREFEITADSARVVFRGLQGSRTVLYSVPLDGGSAPQQLSASEPLTHLLDFRLAPDGSRAVYSFNRYDSVTRVYVRQLYSVPVDGSAPAVRLNGPLPTGGEVLASFQISPDSTCVTYVADQVSDGAFALYCVPIEGGVATQLATLTGYPYYLLQSITPDGTSVVFRTEGDHALFGVRLDGSQPAVRLSGTVGPTLAFAVAPDSAHVAFGAGQTFYSAPLDGSSAPIQLGPPIAGAMFEEPVFADPERVLFRARVSGPGDRVHGQLHGAPIDGSAPAVRLDSTVATLIDVINERGVTAFALDAASGQVLYRADQLRESFFELFRAPIDGSAPSTVLSDVRGSVHVHGDVYQFAVSADGDAVAYFANQDAGYDPDPRAGLGLYAVSLRGPEVPVPLAVPVGVDGLEISPDSRRLVFHADFGIYEPEVRLFSLPLDASAGVVALSPVPVFGSVVEHRIAPDSSRAVYAYEKHDDSGALLFSVALDRSGPPLELTGWSNGTARVFAITPDSQRAVFLGGPGGSADELFAVPLAGQSAPVKLSASLVAGGDVTELAVSPDGRWVAYLADQDADEEYELYRVSIDGAHVIRLNDPLAAGGDVTRFAISPDSTRVVFLADARTDGTFELFSVAIDGRERRGHAMLRARPAPIELSALDSPQEDVLDFRISPDSSRVVFRADQENDEVAELFSVPIAGAAAPTKLNHTPVAGGDVHSFALDASGARVVYLADQDADDQFELHGVPTDGGAPARVLSLPLGPGRDVATHVPFELDPHGRWVLYNADAETDEVYELFAAPLDGRLPARRINGRLLSTELTTVIGKITSRGVLYLADGETAGGYELFLDDSLAEPLPPLRRGH